MGIHTYTQVHYTHIFLKLKYKNYQIDNNGDEDSDGVMMMVVVMITKMVVVITLMVVVVVMMLIITMRVIRVLIQQVLVLRFTYICTFNPYYISIIISLRGKKR